MAGKKPTLSGTPVTSHRHKDKRANIPTEELRDFVAEAEREPKTVLYPRDPSLDPQLVWKGKDEQDRKELEVPAVPVYIQEKIHPQALIEDLRAHKAETGGQLSLFSDFNGIDFEQLVEFYQHELQWSNRLILGDSLLVMTSLAEKEGLKGKVQMIYMDPPYGIKFGSNWQVSTRKRDVHDGKDADLTRQPEQVKAFRDTWQLGIHSYLAYLRDRLVASRELLSDSGSIFVQIGDDNMHLVRCLLDEVFGSENLAALINFRSMTPLGQRGMARVYDYILWYGKNLESRKFRPLFADRGINDEPEFCYLSDGGSYRRLTAGELQNATAEDKSRIFKRSVLTSSGYTPSCTYEFEYENIKCQPLSGKSWRTHRDGMRRLVVSSRLVLLGKNPYFRQYHADFPVIQMENSWHDTAAGYSEEKVYVVQTSDRVIQRCLLMTTDPGDLVLDPTCGSGTTAYVAEQWGRRWITVDTSRVALALARTRIMAARYPYYLLADSPEGATKEGEAAGRAPASPAPTTTGDIRKGFVYKRVPHVTLKSIANNEEIDTIHAVYQEKLEQLRAQLNQALGQAWEEWQVPREAGASWPAKVRELHSQWWALRRERQKEIDASIARRADTELLYDQPYEDSKRVRVAGPFTVESLSPHRVLSTDEERPASEQAGRQASAEGQFETMILENLKKAGVQNTKRNERLKLDRLEPYAGTWLQAAGEYTDSNGLTRRVAISLGPEHGTVGADQVKAAAKEALQGVGFDLLVVCGFAFDAHAGETAKEFAPTPAKGRPEFAVAETTKQYGRLPVMLARIHPDLAMGDELLKKTGAGNLFMVFGEPDVDIRKQKDGQLVVEVRGVDVYDPTTGQIRNSSTDDIACWFIDTDYDGESFFVRHAYFLGAGDPYEKLKKTLRAEIDEAAWASLYSTTSRPFPAPASGKIAVKVINHYGDEVLKVYGVR